MFLWYGSICLYFLNCLILLTFKMLDRRAILFSNCSIDAMIFFSQVFTVAASDERKNVVLLAFETMEKIVREYFPYITETERTTFTDCVRCLTTFTNSRFNSDVSLNAIAFLRFCALKLADGGLICNVKSRVDDLSIPIVDEVALDVENHSNKDDHASFWIPLLTGNLLSRKDLPYAA